jgi:hypothetical protein
MIGVSKWIKVIAIALLFALFAGGWVTLQASQAHVETLSAKLEKATSDSQINLATINALQDENSNINTLLVKRKQQQDQAEGKLHADITQLKAVLADDKCYLRPWPSDVTQRLREPY